MAKNNSQGQVAFPPAEVSKAQSLFDRGLALTWVSVPASRLEVEKSKTNVRGRNRAFVYLSLG